MIAIKKSNTLLCITLFFAPYVIANSASVAEGNATNKYQSNITITNKATSKNKESSDTQSLSKTKELKLTQIIIDIETPGDYTFGILANNNKNKIRVDDDSFLRTSGTVKIYDLRNDKIISVVNLGLENKDLFNDRMMNTSGVFFVTPLKSKSQYLITPNVNVESNDEFDPTYSFTIHKLTFVK